jgi:hypothetical protein
MKTMSKQIQSVQSELSVEELDFVNGGGLRNIVGTDDPQEQIKEALKRVEEFVRPFREAGQAINNAVQYVGSKIAGFFGSLF